MEQRYTKKVLELFISTKEQENRIQQNILYIDSLGIKNDKFYGKDTNRAILITSIDSYKLIKRHHIDIQYGLLGENILVDIDTQIYKLNPKDRFFIGDIEFEITQNCTICNHLSAIDKELPKLLKKDRGIFCRALKDGIIKKGDNIVLK